MHRAAPGKHAVRSMSFFLAAVLAAAVAGPLRAEDPAPAGLRGPETRLAPTHRNVKYGPHERNVLDFWKARSTGPRPLVIYVHGGGFRGGRKESLDRRVLRELLEKGISVAAIHYRLLAHAPLPAAHHDARRAVQFLRSKATEWDIDGSRIGAFGGSAGAQICMWLAFHDDMADASSPDPIARQPTRLACVATRGGQTTMDFEWWKRWVPGYDRPHRAPSEYFGTDSPDEQKKIIERISALSLISRDDPPIYMSYRMAPGDPVPDDPRGARGWKVHHVVFGVRLKERMDALGIEAHLAYPGAETAYPSLSRFLIAHLGRKPEDPKPSSRRRL